jgi:hypothetical protein
MQKTRKGQLCLQKVTIAVLRLASINGWGVSTDGELIVTKPVPTGQTQPTSSTVPLCRFHTLK